MPRWAAALATVIVVYPAVTSTTSYARAIDNPPSKKQIVAALFFDRFDDSCAGPGPDDGCPPINIYRIVIRGPKCILASPSDRAEFGVHVERAYRCRFQSQIMTYRERPDPKRWRDDTAIIYLASHTSIWRAAPSVQVDNGSFAR